MHDYLVQSGFKGNLVLTDTPAEALRLVAAGKYDYSCNQDAYKTPRGCTFTGAASWRIKVFVRSAT